MSRRKPKPFKGWDWTELAERFRLKPKDPYDDDAYLVQLRTHLTENFEDPVVISACKEYLAAIIKAENGFAGPIWEGLAKVEHDYTFMQYFITLVDGM